MNFASTPKGDTVRPAAVRDNRLSRRTATVKAWLAAKPGASAEPFSARKGAAPIAVFYKITGKMFAILSLRSPANVILKCDPYLATMLRKEYAGVGHRSHLDKRYWISVNLDADVPTKEIKRLVSQSYDLIRDNLTAKQRAELERLTSSGRGARNKITRSGRLSEAP
jgi:predicted DNA-binding protein (MmcQ/YjbR family)